MVSWQKNKVVFDEMIGDVRWHEMALAYQTIRAVLTENAVLC